MSNEKHKGEEGYIYLVKNPSYNDICLAAWDSILYAGTPVMYETRYGMDIGVVIGAAPLNKDRYKPGCDCVKGACLVFEPLNSDEKTEEIEKKVEHQCDNCKGCSTPMEINKVKVSGDVLWLDHLATPQEIARYNENCIKEEAAMKLCKEKIVKHKLSMKLITTHFLLGEQKVIFFFTAEERVDFRDLVKDLVTVFKMRIELRQIGVRDESRLIGGLSVCGRDYCCHSITDKPSPVSIKMAKEQNLSLNSMKISGPCGRLLCCLAYEYDYYMEEKSNCPPEGSKLKLQNEIWRVAEINILSRKLTLIGSEGRVLYVPSKEVYYDEETKRWEIDQEYVDEIFSN